MSNYSRVKKYEEVRSRIETEKSELGEVVKQHRDDLSYDHQREYKEAKSTKTSNSQMEYLDEFKKEAKLYNIERGLRADENTHLNILHQMNVFPKNESQYFEEMDAQPQTFDEIASKVLEMTEEIKVEDSTGELDIDEVIQTLKEDQDDIGQSFVEAAFFDTLDPSELHVEDNLFENVNQELIEETKQLRLAVEEYGEDVEELHVDVQKTNNVLNWILGILIFTFFAIIIFGILWFTKFGGF